MTKPIVKESSVSTTPESSRTSLFLDTIAENTKDEVHLRLLRACRNPKFTEAIEAELGIIITEILNEDQNT